MGLLNDRAKAVIKALGDLDNIGLPKMAIFTHLCDESNFFSRFAGQFNYAWFPITSRWNGRVAVVVNKNGEPLRFADFDSIEEMLTYYIEFIKKNFPHCLDCGDCWICYLEGLSNGPKKWNDSDIYSRRLRELYQYLDGEDEVRMAFDLYVH